MTDYSDYVHCGEVFKSSILSNEKSYLIKCIKCQDLFQLEAFLTHSKQNLCELREINIKEEVLDDGCLSGCPVKDKSEGITSNSIDEIEVNPVCCLINKDSLVFLKEEDVSNTDEKDHVRCKIGSNNAEVDAEQQEFETDVSVDDDFNLDDDKSDSENAKGQAQRSHRVTVVSLATLGPHLPSLLHEQIAQILKIYENLPHLWNTSLLEHRCKNKRCKAEMEMIKRIKESLGYEIDCETLNKYLKNIHLYFSQEKRKRLNDEHLDNSSLYQHLLFLFDHVGPFRCSHCNFENHSIFYYKVHLSKHDGSMPFKCSQCGKEFKRRSSYDTHARRHFEDFKYNCQVCGAKFLNSYNLKIHMSSHTNVRDCICKTCGKAFKTKDHLKSHEVVHSDVRKYVCTVCSKSFNRGYILTRHMRSHRRNLSEENTTASEDKMADTESIVKDNLNKIKIELSDAEVDGDQQEFKTDVSLDDDFDLDDDKYDSEDAIVTDITECLVKRKLSHEEEPMHSREFVTNYIENHDNVMALIEAYKAQTPLWSRTDKFRDKEQRQQCWEIVTKEINQKRNLNLKWNQVYTLILHVLRIYRDDLKKLIDSQTEKSTYTALWFCKHMQFLQPFTENKPAKCQTQKIHSVTVLSLDSLDPHLPSSLQEQIVKIYENLPHLWNTSLIEHRCKNKRCESEMEMIKRIEESLGYKIDCETLNKYLKNIQCYFIQEKSRRQNDEHLENSGLYQHLVFLLDHVGPFRCSQCDFENYSIYRYKVHLSEHDGSMPLKCSQCGKEFKLISSYDNHAKCHLKDFKHICQVCGKKFLTPTHMKVHMRSHTNERDCICKICGKAFKTKDHLKSHEATHSDVRKYVCTVCSKSFKLGYMLTRHMRIHGRNLSDENTTTSEDKMADTEIIVKDNLNKIKIELSDAEVDGEQQEFETDVSLDDDYNLDDDKSDSENAKGQSQRSHRVTVLSLATLGPHVPSLLHEQIVKILKIYENLPHLWNTSLIEHRCKNKRCKAEMEMIKRIKESLGYEIDCGTLNKYLQNIQCYFMQEKSRRQNDDHLENSGLYQHLVFLLDHVGPFRCSQCDFENYSIYRYKVHLSEHDGSMPLKCSQCGKEFKTISSYDNHARCHLKDFKHICQVCGRKFLSPTNLKMHMRTHTNVRDYICKACGKEFKTKHNLKIHEVTHSDLRKYVCTICSKSFKLDFKLTQHMRTHRRNLSDENTTRSADKMADTEIIVKENLNEIL